ncbi:VPA1269 family protein [Paraburkholderia sp. Clong3]|uniref:VPA1269 family protein n=1 Tax=Paraburkholderia sp. Clong3 TaxID=2991061 RepID=UPI003D1ABF4D
MKHPTRAVSAAIRAFASIGSSHDFARKIDALMDAGRECEKSPGQKNHIYGWLLRLWSGGIVAISRDFPFATKTSLFPNPFMMHGFPWLSELQEAYGGANRARVVTTVFRIAGRTLGVMEPGDIVPETVAPVPPIDESRLLSFMVPPLLLVQRDYYGSRATYNRSSWGLGRVKRKVGVDRTFAWATEHEPTLSDWRHAMSQWLSDQRQGLALRTYMAERALQYLIDNPNLPRTVAAYCDRKASIEPTWSEWVDARRWADSSRRHYTNYFADFFDWYLATVLTGEDDFGRPVASPNHYNPITRLAVRARQAETHREALPLRYLHELVRIVTENDYAWPKTLRGDYFMWKNPVTGEFSKQWNPVRAYAILVKLMLPLRTYQVRMVDSGEADTEQYDGKEWLPNTGRLAPKKERRRQTRRGFLRKFDDAVTGREFTGFFVNTNKTADSGKDQNDRGYEIPWQHDEVIRIARELREWQETFNPVTASLPWQAIHDRTVLRSYTPEMLRLREPACFLFRDPCAVYPSEPVLDSRLQVFWALLLRQLETRVLARGERLANGRSDPIRDVAVRWELSGKLRFAYPAGLSHHGVCHRRWRADTDPFEVCCRTRDDSDDPLLQQAGGRTCYGGSGRGAAKGSTRGDQQFPQVPAKRRGEKCQLVGHLERGRRGIGPRTKRARVLGRWRYWHLPRWGDSLRSGWSNSEQRGE